MEIKNVGGINAVPNPQNSRKITPAQDVNAIKNNDLLEVSQEARLLEDEDFIRDILNKTPDINQERIDQVKEKLQNGSYNNKETIDTLTQNLMKALGL
ncbi:MAG: flagellar biosynthesis anti-sigma factor FlgM [Brevinema sp.]